MSVNLELMEVTLLLITPSSCVYTLLRRVTDELKRFGNLLAG